MNDGNNQELTAAERRAREAVRGLSRPVADPAFRARLKQDFMSGAIAAGAGPAVAEVRPDRRRFRPWMGYWSLAAAAVLLVVILAGNPLPGPSVVATNGQGSVVVDGRRFAGEDLQGLGETVAAGSVLEVEDGATVDIEYPGTLVMRLAAGSTYKLPPRPGRWIGRTIDSRLPVGEISILTGPGFSGNHLTVATPDGLAVISGTLASVVTNDELTCICLIEGSMKVVTAERDLGYVEPGKRWVIYRDGSAPDYLDIAPPHREHMQNLDRDEAGIFE